MMNTINVPLVEIENQDLDTALELGGARFDVECVNWPETFPYAPLCSGRVARTQDALVVDFRVSGLDLRAQNLTDNGRQWEDSCVEVFIKDPQEDTYYNFEINALGMVLACRGADRHGREARPASEMGQILRFATDNNVIPDPTGELTGVQTWRVGVVIPFQLIGVDSKHLPKSIRANFYKCGDKTAHPHYLSWSPIDTPKPDFHRPEFFGELLLK
jgi:hypothetical protein